jgi:hypothetical protein
MTREPDDPSGGGTPPERNGGGRPSIGTPSAGTARIENGGADSVVHTMAAPIRTSPADPTNKAPGAIRA